MSLCSSKGDLVLFDFRKAKFGEFFQCGDFDWMLHAEIKFLLKILFQIEKGGSRTLQAGVAPIGEEFP